MDSEAPADAVTSADALPEARPLSRDALVAPFHEAETPESAWRVGTEAEKIVVTQDGAALPFEGPRGVQAILGELSSRHGWASRAEIPGGPVIMLARADASVTLEPGGQVELSGAPLRTIHETEAELAGHGLELRAIGDLLGVRFLGLGFHPLARQADLPWVPKLRYAIMREYLPTRGSMALDMMRRTATVQANYDYASEEDAMRKLRVSLAVSPIVTALFANSPLVEGSLTGQRSRRAQVWLHMDPDRSGLLPFAWREDARYEDYVEWALDVPMFGLKRGDRLLPSTGQTFRQLMADGFEGHRAEPGDWVTHLNTLFPEVRLKRTLEIRGADGQPEALSCALPALMKGILYDSRALASAEELTRELSVEAAERARADVAELGLGGSYGDRPMREYAEALVDIAGAGLARIAHLDSDGADERRHLTPLLELVSRGECPADALVRRLEQAPERPLVDRILTHASL